MKKLDGFRDVFKHSKRRRKPTQIFCPRCASPKIQLSSSLDVWLTPKSVLLPRLRLSWHYCYGTGTRRTTSERKKTRNQIKINKDQKEDSSKKLEQ